MTMEQQSNAKRSAGMRFLVLVAVVLMIIITGWVLVAVSSTLPPRSAFVVLPNTQLSKAGVAVAFATISPITANGVAHGISGYLLTASGAPVSGGTVYITYYYQASYRTERTTTDQTGYFVDNFPMNWTGMLQVTLTYFGDSQYRGISQVFSVAGENLSMGVL
jgi:hypothetical protein